MLDLEKLPTDALYDVRQRLGADDPTSTECDAKIARMSASHFFDEWCNWNGLVGWGGQIRSTLDAARKAEIAEKETGR